MIRGQDEQEIKKKTQSGEIQNGSLAGKTMWVAIWFLAIPILIQQILVATVGLADKMFAGALPEDIVLPAMDAIGIGSYIGWFISIAVSGVGIGAQALIARAMGRGDVEFGQRAVAQSLILALIWGIVVAIALWMLADSIGDVCQLSGQAKTYLTQYIRIVAIGMPALSMYLQDVYTNRVELFVLVDLLVNMQNLALAIWKRSTVLLCLATEAIL